MYNILFFHFPKGGKIPNQKILENEKGYTFISYNSYICYIPKDKRKKICVSGLWDYSRTTNKYFKRFLNEYANLNENTQSIKTGIQDKRFKLVQEWDLINISFAH